ncbi:MAG: hypothetical protein CMH27_02610 [Micavibrio sp.]|nr:hypothetical protein [Micavibrio sp.]|tara:strand:+ start:462 stop:1556 length:1095 start_codon:yes stop_codon:yes gene_type:complete
MVNQTKNGMDKSIRDLGQISAPDQQTVSRDYNDFSVFDQNMGGEKSVHTQLNVTDFTKTNFSHNAISKMDASSAADVQGPDVNTDPGEAMRVQSNYMQADTEIKANIEAAVTEVLGPEQGKEFIGQIFPAAGATKVQAAATMVDPTGIAGSIYSVVSAVQEQNARFGTEETRQILDQALNQLQEASKQEQMRTVFDTTPPFELPYPEYNFDAVQNGNQLLQFCQRDVSQDPVMQQTQASIDNAKANEAQINYNEAHMGENATASRVEAELSAGNEEFMKTIAGGDSLTAENMETYASAAVDMVGDGLKYPPRMDFEGLDIEFASAQAIMAENAAREANEFKLSFNQEAALERAAGLNRPSSMMM